MREIRENQIVCRFPRDWPTIKFDDHAFYRNASNLIQTVKGVDVVAVGEPKMYLIEIKDYRGSAIENKPKLTTSALIQDVAGKVKDTLAVLYAAHRDGGQDDLAPLCRHLFGANRRPVDVVLLLEQDGDRKGRQRRDGIALTTLETRLAAILKPFHVHLRVVDCTASNIGGWRAEAMGKVPA